MAISAKLVTRLLIVLLTVLFSILIFLPNYPFKYPRDGLDPSYDIANVLATAQGKIYGQEVVFPYGPLGFLRTRLSLGWNSNLILLSDLAILLGGLLITGAITAAIINSISQVTGTLKGIGMAATAVFAAFAFAFITNDLGNGLDQSFSWGLLALFLFLKSLSGKSIFPAITFRAIAYIILVIASMIKFNAVMLSIAFIFFFIVFEVVAASKIKLLCLQDSPEIQLRYKLAAIIPAVILLVFTAAALNVSIFDYLKNGLTVSAGFDSAMYLAPDKLHAGTASKVLIFYLSFIAFALMSIIRSNTQLQYFLAASVSCCCFVMAKSSLVRADDHLNTFGAHIWIPLVFFWHFSGNPLIKRIAVAFMAIYIGSFCNFPNYSLTGLIKTKISYFTAVLNYDSLNSTTQIAGPLPESIIQQVQGKTVDIIPWDISKLYVAQLTYSPRPLLQSYHAYSPALDKLDADHFLSKAAPQSLILTNKTIDQRYFIWDTPQTFETISTRYQPGVRSGDYFVMDLNPLINSDVVKSFNERELTGAFNQWINLPSDNRDLKISFGINYSTKGRLKKLFYQPQDLKVRFKLSDGSEVSHKLILPLSLLDLPAKHYVANTTELYDYLKKDFTGLKTIKSVKITSKDPQAFKVKITIKLKEYLT